MCRIYIPYVVALGIAIAGCSKWHGLHAYGPWVEAAWSRGPDWKSISQHLLFIGDYPARFNFSFWTLIQEMRISLVFPFLCAMTIRLRSRLGLLLAVGLVIAGGIIGHFGFIPYTYAGTICYAGMFILGILLAQNAPLLRRKLSSLGRISYWGLLLTSVVIYAYAPSLFNAKGWENTAWDGLTAIGAAGIILFALEDARIEALLLHPTIIFLGKISYSIYLLHAPILLVFGYIFYQRYLPVSWLLPYLITTIALATLMYYSVEQPAIHLGKILSARIYRYTDSSKAGSNI